MKWYVLNYVQKHKQKQTKEHTSEHKNDSADKLTAYKIDPEDRATGRNGDTSSEHRWWIGT